MTALAVRDLPNEMHASVRTAEAAVRELGLEPDIRWFTSVTTMPDGQTGEAGARRRAPAADAPGLTDKIIILWHQNS